MPSLKAAAVRPRSVDGLHIRRFSGAVAVDPGRWVGGAYERVHSGAFGSVDHSDPPLPGPVPRHAEHPGVSLVAALDDGEVAGCRTPGPGPGLQAQPPRSPQHADVPRTRR